jgi:hypothetical protein
LTVEGRSHSMRYAQNGRPGKERKRQMTEIRTKAWSDGRPITLDPFWTTVLTVKPKRVENSLGAGLRVEWLSAEGSPDSEWESMHVSCGGGFGSPWLTMTVTMRDGTSRDEVLDGRTLVQSWFEAVLAGGATPKQWWLAQFPVGTRVEVRRYDGDDEQIQPGTVESCTDEGVGVRRDPEPEQDTTIDPLYVWLDADMLIRRLRKETTE